MVKPQPPSIMPEPEHIPTTWGDIIFGCIVVLVVGGIIFGVTYGIRNSDITTYDYQDVKRKTEEYPELLPLVRGYMEDGYMVECEHWAFDKEYNKCVRRAMLGTNGDR